MKYTIIDGDRRAQFISRDYDLIEDAEKRLEVLKAKFADRFKLAIVQIDDAGNFHELKAPQTSTPPEQSTQPIRQRPNPRKERP